MACPEDEEEIENESELEEEIEEYEDAEDFKTRSRQVDNFSWDITSLGESVPLYEVTLIDKHGKEYAGLNVSRQDAHESAF